MLQIDFHDIKRATLPVRSGNEGWIGVSPRGDEYHTVVPVDVQIARGVMACNRPTDGTPFGGYSGWLYFRCPPYEDEGRADPDLHEVHARITARNLVKWLASYGIVARCETDEVAVPGARKASVPERSPQSPPAVDRARPMESAPAASEELKLSCSECGTKWGKISELLKDAEVKLVRYRASPESFRCGFYIFAHDCGGTIEVPVTVFARPGHGPRSLIGTHACPGMCYYETSLRSCSATCEGSRYRRIAEHLKCR